MAGKRYEDDAFIEDEKDLRHLEDPVDDPDAQAPQGERPRPAPLNVAVLPPLYRVKIQHSSEILVFAGPPEGEVLEGAAVVVPTRYGRDMGRCLGRVKDPDSVNQDDFPQICRIANEEDIQRSAENRERERTAFEVCRDEDRQSPSRYEARFGPLRPGGPEGPVLLHGRKPGRLPGTREGSGVRLQDEDRAAPDRCSRRGAGDGRMRSLRKGFLLSRR